MKMFTQSIGRNLVLSAALPLAMAVGSLGAREPQVITWDGPGADVPASPDYEVTLRSGGKSWPCFTYYSYARAVDKLLDPEGKYIKLSFLALHSNEYKRPEDNKDTYAHSWASFDFDGGPISVEVRIKRPLDGLTLPLQSCGIFPSTLGIKAQVVGGDTIRFNLDKPAKFAVVPNPVQALEKLNTTESKQAFEGYRNPLFLFVRAPETGIPDKSAPGTLIVKPGCASSVEEFAKAKVIFFEPGMHDYSEFNPADPEHYITLHTGQTAYLGGGAYVYGVFATAQRHPAISEMPLLRGRGTMSGAKQRWSDLPYRTTLERGVRLDGIQITDANNHISHSNAPVHDVAVVGAWHGNTDGFTREVPASEPHKGWHVDDCFVMAADTNLKVGGPARVRNYTVWQLANAEPLWIRNPDHCVIDGLQVIAFHAWSSRQTINITSGTVKNSVFKNISIEAPFVPLLFLMTAGGQHASPVFENTVFENVTVTTPHICRKSVFGARDGKVVFRNLIVNGKKVTPQNCSDYFEFLEGVTIGKEIVFE
jgi:hypothetical protein